MAAFSIGVMADSLRLPFEDSLKKCRELGADGVQLYAVEGEMSPETQTPETDCTQTLPAGGQRAGSLGTLW